MDRRFSTGLTGTVLYMEAGIDQVLHHLDERRYEASFDEGESEQGCSYAFAVQVGPFYGGGFEICPEAHLDDGLLDACIAHPPLGTVRAVYLFLRAKGGKHTGFEQIDMRRFRTLHVEFDEVPPAQIDGERIEARTFDVSVEPKALNVLRP